MRAAEALLLGCIRGTPNQTRSVRKLHASTRERPGIQIVGSKHVRTRGTAAEYFFFFHWLVLRVPDSDGADDARVSNKQ